MRAVMFRSVGGPEVLEIVEQTAIPPGPGEVLIRVTSAGLNRADALFRQGRHLLRPRLPSRIGMEAAGIVEAAGDGAPFQPGDRVGALPAVYDISMQGGVAEYVTLPARFLVPTPSSVDDRDAGGVWMQFLTAWGALNHLVGLKREQFVVITAGSSSVGLAAVQVANRIGAVPIVTTTSAVKVQGLKDNGAPHVIEIGRENYLERVRAITGGEGVHAVFDPVAGASVGDHIRACRPEAWIMIYGVLDDSPMRVNAGHLLAKNLNLRGYTLLPLLRDTQALAEAVKAITDGLNGGSFSLNIDRRFPMDQTPEAHRYMESNRHIGKIVINP